MELLEDLGMKTNKSGNSYRVGLYLCGNCNKKFELYTHNVKRRKSEYCINCTLIQRNTKHGCAKRGDKLYNVYRNILRRCTNENDTGYHNYGGRGISVCNEWKNDVQSFVNFAKKNGWNESLTIDRIDTNGNYEPSNVRFITLSDNAKNRRDKASKQSKFKYVVWNDKNQNWMANVYINKMRKYLGSFESDTEANKAIKNFFDNCLDGLIKD